jgi:hypothetical protein
MDDFFYHHSFNSFNSDDLDLMRRQEESEMHV